MKPKDPHATVKVDGYTIPLIGIPKEQTQETCDRCHATIHISEAILLPDGKVLCSKCAPTNPP